MFFASKRVHLQLLTHKIMHKLLTAAAIAAILVSCTSVRKNNLLNDFAQYVNPMVGTDYQVAPEDMTVQMPCLHLHR